MASWPPHRHDAPHTAYGMRHRHDGPLMVCGRHRRDVGKACGRPPPRAAFLRAHCWQCGLAHPWFGELRRYCSPAGPEMCLSVEARRIDPQADGRDEDRGQNLQAWGGRAY